MPSGQNRIDATIQQTYSSDWRNVLIIQIIVDHASLSITSDSSDADQSVRGERTAFPCGALDC